jgi:hypothetical protein
MALTIASQCPGEARRPILEESNVVSEHFCRAIPSTRVKYAGFTHYIGNTPDDIRLTQAEVIPAPSAMVERFFDAVTAVVEAARAPAPFMVTREGAANLCEMSVNTYDKYVKLGFLPAMNATGRVSIETVRRACLKLDGIEASEKASEDPAERALRQWERGAKQ